MSAGSEFVACSGRLALLWMTCALPSVRIFSSTSVAGACAQTSASCGASCQQWNRCGAQLIGFALWRWTRSHFIVQPVVPVDSFHVFALL